MLSEHKLWQSKTTLFQLADLQAIKGHVQVNGYSYKKCALRMPVFFRSLKRHETFQYDCEFFFENSKQHQEKTIEPIKLNNE